MAELLEGAVEMQRLDDGRVHITRTPPVARIALEVIQAGRTDLIRCTGRVITFSDHFGHLVTYEVTGWDDLHAALVLQRKGDGV